MFGHVKPLHSQRNFRSPWSPQGSGISIFPTIWWGIHACHDGFTRIHHRLVRRLGRGFHRNANIRPDFPGSNLKGLPPHVHVRRTTVGTGDGSAPPRESRTYRITNPSTTRGREEETTCVTTTLPTDLHITVCFCEEVASNPHSPMKEVGG